MPTLSSTGHANLDRLVSDPRYWNTQHPEHDEVFAAVKRAFQEAYPESASENQTTTGSVHVRAYTREQDGKSIAVSEYDRTQKIAFHPTPGLGANSRDAIEDVSSNPFHDLIQWKVARAFRKLGAKVEQDVRVTVAATGMEGIPDVVAVFPNGERFVVEVKTGLRPRFTNNQPAVYSRMEQGEEVYSNDPKVERLGFKRGELLPRFCVYTLHVSLLGGITTKTLHEACCSTGSNKFN